MTLNLPPRKLLGQRLAFDCLTDLGCKLAHQRLYRTRLSAKHLVEQTGTVGQMGYSGRQMLIAIYKRIGGLIYYIGRFRRRHHHHIGKYIVAVHHAGKTQAAALRV